MPRVGIPKSRRALEREPPHQEAPPLHPDPRLGPADHVVVDGVLVRGARGGKGRTRVTAVSPARSASRRRPPPPRRCRRPSPRAETRTPLDGGVHPRVGDRERRHGRPARRWPAARGDPVAQVAADLAAVDHRADARGPRSPRRPRPSRPARSEKGRGRTRDALGLEEGRRPRPTRRRPPSPARPSSATPARSPRSAPLTTSFSAVSAAVFSARPGAHRPRAHQEPEPERHGADDREHRAEDPRQRAAPVPPGAPSPSFPARCRHRRRLAADGHRVRKGARPRSCLRPPCTSTRSWRSGHREIPSLRRPGSHEQSRQARLDGGDDDFPGRCVRTAQKKTNAACSGDRPSW